MSMHIYPTWSPDHVMVDTPRWSARLNRDDLFDALDLLRTQYKDIIVHLEAKQ